MREYPKGGIIGKTVHLFRSIQSLQVPLYAANACYFIVLAVFPALLLLLSLLRHTPLEVERLGEMLYGILPESLAAGGEELILLTWDNITGTVVGVSAITALWSAGRGIYGVLTGLNAIYGVQENRGYFHTRLLCAGYTLLFLLVLLLTLLLHVFGTGVLGWLSSLDAPFFRFLTGIVDLRFFLLVFLQTALFAAMFTALPNRKNKLRDSLPGAFLSSLGWLIFSHLFSLYVEHFPSYTAVYGSVYAVALSMLWLYFCILILFYGGLLNRLLSGPPLEI